MHLEMPHARLSADEWLFHKCLGHQSPVYWKWRIMRKYCRVFPQRKNPGLRWWMIMIARRNQVVASSSQKNVVLKYLHFVLKLSYSPKWFENLFTNYTVVMKTVAYSYLIAWLFLLHMWMLGVYLHLCDLSIFTLPGAFGNTDSCSKPSIVWWFKIVVTLF